MRVLFISAAILACATAAPSGALLPISAPVVLSAAVVQPALPTISPGDIQAAAIDAKVAIEDQARIVADQAILLADQLKEQAELAFEEQTSKTNEASDLDQEKNQEAVWTAEEQKWQALETVNTSEAQIDGSVASSAPTLAKAFGELVIPAPIITPFATPIGSPIFYATPGIVAPIPKSIVQPETKPDTEKTEIETEKTEISTEKATEISTEKVAEIATEAPIEAVSTEKAAEPAALGEKPSEIPQSSAIVAFSQSYKFTDPWPLSPITYFQPGLQSLATIRQIPGPIAYPQAIIATQWK